MGLLRQYNIKHCAPSIQLLQRKEPRPILYTQFGVSVFAIPVCKSVLISALFQLLMKLNLNEQTCTMNNFNGAFAAFILALLFSIQRSHTGRQTNKDSNMGAGRQFGCRTENRPPPRQFIYSISHGERVSKIRKNVRSKICPFEIKKFGRTSELFSE